MARDWCSMTLEQRVQHLELELRKLRPSVGSDSSALLKRIGALENEIERLKPQSSSTSRTVPQYQVAKPARVDNSELDNRIKRLEQSPKQPDLSGRIARIETEIKSLSSMRSNPTQPKVALPENKDVVDRIKKLEREVERLKVKENPKPGMYNKDTYFDDLLAPLIGAKLESPSSHITYSVSRTGVVMAKTCDWNDDWLAMTIQMSHRWKTGSAVYPHLHWLQSAAAMPNLGISWVWQTNGALLKETWPNVKHSANVFNWSSGTLNQITKFGSITPPTGAGLSDLLLVKIWRDVANESTLFTGAEVDANVQDNVAAYSFDIHFEIDQAGSDEEYTK